jgi:hypothetical protein
LFARVCRGVHFVHSCRLLATQILGLVNIR